MFDTKLLSSQMTKSVQSYLRNLGPRPPILLCLVMDRSGSMGARTGPGQPRPIDLLNQTVFTFRQALRTAPELKIFHHQIQLACLSYADHTTLHHSFLPVEEIQSFQLEAGGQTFSGTALLDSLSVIRMQRAALHGQYKTMRCLLFWMSDGLTSDADSEKLRQVIQHPPTDISILPIGIGPGANLSELKAVSTAKNHQVLRMEKSSPELFASLAQVLVASSSQFSEQYTAQEQLDLSHLHLPEGMSVQMFSGVL